MSRVANTFGFSFGIVVVTLMLVGGRGAVAESGYGMDATSSGHHFDGHGDGGYGGGSYGTFSSTALEGALRGKAAVIDAAGRFQVNAAEAAILREQARALDRENDFAHIVAFQARRELARKTREAERVRRAAEADAGRVLLAARHEVVHRVAYRLSAVELNVATGQIGWPAVFGTAKFAAERERMQELFSRQARYASPDAALAAEIVRCSERMARALRDDRRVMPRDEYLSAQRFLLGLRFAAMLEA